MAVLAIWICNCQVLSNSGAVYTLADMHALQLHMQEHRSMLPDTSLWSLWMRMVEQGQWTAGGNKYRWKLLAMLTH